MGKMETSRVIKAMDEKKYKIKLKNLFFHNGNTVDAYYVFVKRKVYQFSIEKYTIILKKINGFLAIPQFL